MDEEAIAVFTEQDLIDAISQDNGYNYVYLGADIQMQNGAEIFQGKETLVIDGFYPLDGTGEIHSLTDKNSTIQTDTIYVGASSDISVTIKNMIIHGNNYYGVPCIYEGAAFAGVSVTYENVTYIGPQLIHNPNGLTRVKDCDITIEYPSETLRAQQAGEVCKLELEGNVTIQHNVSTLSALWFRGELNESYLKVIEDANVTVTTTGYFIFAALASLSARPIIIEIQSGAAFNLNTRTGFFLDTLHEATSFLVDTGASFKFIQSTATISPSMSIINDLTINAGATFYMQGDYSGLTALIRFSSGSCSLNINTPRSFVLYRTGLAPVISAASSYSISFYGGQLNYWNTARAFPLAGTYEDTPDHKWYSDNGNTFTILGSVNLFGTTITSSIFDHGPDISYLRIQDAGVLAIGDPTLVINPVVDDATPITGRVEPSANVRVNYTIDGQDREIENLAFADGTFTVLTGEALPIDTLVLVSVNTPFLIKERTVQTVYAGELVILSAPSAITFVHSPVSLNPLLLGRSFPDDVVSVYDDRVYSTAWQLTATISGDLTTPKGRTLPNAVVFVNEIGYTPLSGTPISIFEGEDNEGTIKTTQCSWDADKGILLHATEAIYNGQTYSAVLSFNLNILL